MSSRRKLAGIVGVALVVACAAVTPLANAQPPVTPPTPAARANTTAVDNYGSCLAGQKQGDLLLMIDESGSLSGSDPSAARVTAANYLVDRLSTFAASAGVAVDVAVAGFSTDFTPELPWTSVLPASVGGLHGAVDAFKTRTAGRDTDYWTALDRARAYLADRGPGPDGARRCQAIAWFTDGKLDFDPRDGLERPFAPGVIFDSPAGVQQGVDMALDSICKQGGIADQIRSSGIVTFGVGLSGPTATAADFDSMKSIVTGEPGPRGQCGNITSPRPGEFYLAQDLDSLLFAFDALTTPGQAPLTTDAGVCQVQVCEEAKHRFVLDDSIGSVDVLATSDAPGLQPVLIGPTGQSVPLNTSSLQTQTVVDGSDVNYKWESDKTLRVTMTKAPAGQWSGAWALAFVDPAGAATTARSKTNIHISGNLFPQWTNADSVILHSGVVTKDVSLAMVDASGSSVDPHRILGTATLSATLVDANGKDVARTRDLSKEDIGGPVELDLSNVDPGQATLRLTLTVTTAAAPGPGGIVQPGTELTPRSIDVPVEVGTPVGYPTVAGVLDFGDIEEAGTATASLSVTGPGCVWIDSSKPPNLLGVPDGVGTVSVVAAQATSKDTCISIAEGQTSTLDVGLETENVASGALAGSISVMAAPEDGSNPVPQEVRFTAQLDRPLDETVFAGALLAALLIGIGLPFLFLYLAKWLTARVPALPLVAEEIPITVDSGSVLRDGAPFALRDTDLVTPVQGLHRPARRLTVGSLTLKTHIGRSPFGVGYVTAEKSGVLSASSDTPASIGKPPRARMSLAVHNKWILLHDPAGPVDAGTVILLAGGTTTPAQRDEVAEDLARRLPALLTDLRANGQAAGADVSSEPDGSGSPFGGSTAGGAADPDPFGQSSDPFGPSGDPFDLAPSPSSDPFAPSDANGGSSDPFGSPSSRSDPW